MCGFCVLSLPCFPNDHTFLSLYSTYTMFFLFFLSFSFFFFFFLVSKLSQRLWKRLDSFTVQLLVGCVSWPLFSIIKKRENLVRYIFRPCYLYSFVEKQNSLLPEHTLPLCRVAWKWFKCSLKGQEKGKSISSFFCLESPTLYNTLALVLPVLCSVIDAHFLSFFFFSRGRNAFLFHLLETAYF